MQHVILARWPAPSHAYLRILMASLALVNRRSGHGSLLQASTVVSHAIQCTPVRRRMTTSALGCWRRIPSHVMAMARIMVVPYRLSLLISGVVRHFACC